VKAAYINPFIDAVRRLFKTMLTLPVSIGPPGLNQEARPRHEVCGVIGVRGEVSGQVVVSMPPSLAASLASELIGDPVEGIDEDCLDAVGEIANMIAGNARTDFPERAGTISVPEVVIGRENVIYPAATPIISIPCETGKGPLHIDVALKKNNH
jgi:chemotaxis protein CheX